MLKFENSESCHKCTPVFWRQKSLPQKKPGRFCACVVWQEVHFGWKEPGGVRKVIVLISSLFPRACCCFRAILIVYISFILPKGNTCVFLETGRQPIFGLLSLDPSQCLSSSWLRTGAQSRVSENSLEECVELRLPSSSTADIIEGRKQVQ